MPISSSSSLVTFTCRGPSQWWSLGPPMKNHLSRSARPLTCPYLTSPPPALQKTAPPLPHRLPGNPTANCTARCTHRGTIQASLGQANKVKPNLLAAWLPVCLPVLSSVPGGLACIRTVVLHQNTLSPFPRTQRNAMQRHESSLTLLYSNRRTNRSLCGKEGRSTGPTQAAADPDILSKIMRRRCPTQTGFCLTALIGLRNCYSHRHNGVRSSRDPPRLSFTMCHARPLNNFLMNVGNH